MPCARRRRARRRVRRPRPTACGAQAGRVPVMSGGRTAPLNPVRVEKAALFYNAEPVLRAEHAQRHRQRRHAAAAVARRAGRRRRRREAEQSLTTAAVRVGTRVTAVFVGALGAGSLVAGVAVGCCSHVARDASDLDATLRGAARAKLRKIAIAAAAFSGAAGCARRRPLPRDARRYAAAAPRRLRRPRPRAPRAAAHARRAARPPPPPARRLLRRLLRPRPPPANCALWGALAGVDPTPLRAARGRLDLRGRRRLAVGPARAAKPGATVRAARCRQSNLMHGNSHQCIFARACNRRRQGRQNFLGAVHACDAQRNSVTAQILVQRSL